MTTSEKNQRSPSLLDPENRVRLQIHTQNTSSMLPDLQLENWRNIDTHRGANNSSTSRSPVRDNSGVTGQSPLANVYSARQENGSRDESVTGAAEFSSEIVPPMGTIGAAHSDGFSGDSDDILGISGMPPRTAFLTREEQSEDSRLLQQILKESEEEIAASIADRTKEGGVVGTNGKPGAGGSSIKTEFLPSGAAGGGTGSRGEGSTGDLYGVESLLAEFGDGRYSAGGGAGGDDDDALQSLDVDRIIESMELEAAGEDPDKVAAVATAASNSSVGVVPWRTRRRSFATGSSNVSGGGGVINDGRSSADRRELTGLASAAAGANLSSVSATATDTDNAVAGRPRRGSTAEPLPVSPKSAGAAARSSRGMEGEEAGTASRARRKGGPGERVSLGSVSMVAVGDGKGVNGRGDGGLGAGPLGKAEAAELRLMRGGNREMISPLQVGYTSWRCVFVGCERVWGGWHYYVRIYCLSLLRFI